MNHQQFEDWLFISLDAEEAPLPEAQQEALQEHLQICLSCQTLAESWKEISYTLRSEPVLEPQPGFSARWQERFEADKVRLHRRQSLAALGFAVAGSFLLFGSLAILAFPLLDSPSVVLWAWFYRLAALVISINNIGETVLDLAGAAGGALPILAWIFFTGMLAEMAALWIVSYRVLTSPRRVTR